MGLVSISKIINTAAAYHTLLGSIPPSMCPGSSPYETVHSAAYLIIPSVYIPPCFHSPVMRLLACSLPSFPDLCLRTCLIPVSDSLPACLATNLHANSLYHCLPGLFALFLNFPVKTLQLPSWVCCAFRSWVSQNLTSPGFPSLSTWTGLACLARSSGCEAMEGVPESCRQFDCLQCLFKTACLVVKLNWLQRLISRWTRLGYLTIKPGSVIM